MFSLKTTLAGRRLPPGYNKGMGIVVLCGRRPVSITRLRTSPCPQSVVVHLKSLVQLTPNVSAFIDAQFRAMQRLFAESDLAVLRGTLEDLSASPALQSLSNLNVGQCLGGQPTPDQMSLFANRANVAANDLVVYLVATLVGGAGNFVGCASYPNGQPGAAVIQASAPWLTAHEVGHVLGLNHVCEFPTSTSPNPPAACIRGSGQSDSLMFPNVGWTNVPPDLSSAEAAAMINSNLTVSC
jgi:hypothetical protein